MLERVELSRVRLDGDVMEKYRLLRVMEHKMQFQERVINRRRAEYDRLRAEREERMNQVLVARTKEREIKRKMLYMLRQIEVARKYEEAKRKKKEEVEWRAKLDEIAETQRKRDQEIEDRERLRKEVISRETPVFMKPAKPYGPRFRKSKQSAQAPPPPPAKSDNWTSGKKADRGMPTSDKGRVKFRNKGGFPIKVDQEFTSPLTLVLVGKIGNGKSATGNSIIGEKKFESMPSSSGVTTTSKIATTVLEDGRKLNVIDTPGLFDSSLDPELIKKEIFGCINLARHGIHGVLVVFSVHSRFSVEETAVISSLVTLFGSRIYDYMIVVFTCGDELDHHKKTLEDFLSGCPQSLKEMFSPCGNRFVLFDNRTEDKIKKSKQVQQLLSCVNMVLKKNGGEPFTNEIFTELEFEKKFKDIQMSYEQLLEEEQAARLKAEENANTLKKDLESAKQAAKGRCMIL